MKKQILILASFITLLFTSCTPAGTVENVDHFNDSIEVYRYYFQKGDFVYITFYKGQMQPTATWTQKKGKNNRTYGNTIINLDQNNQNRPAKSFKIESLKVKGIVLDKREGKTGLIIIQTETDIVETEISSNIINLIQVGDTIK